MIGNDDGILHEEGLVCEFRGCVPVCGDGEAVWHVVHGVGPGVVAHLGAFRANGRARIDLRL